MNELVTRPGVIRAHAEIVELAERCRDRFVDHPAAEAVRRRGPGWEPFDPYRDAEYDDDDQYHVLPGPQMPTGLRAAILRGVDPRQVRGGLWIQLNRYDVGDYVLPHRDTHQQGLYVLTSSDADGLVVERRAGEVVFVPDRAGTSVHHDPAAWHWVDPVCDSVRYTLVTIPPLPLREAPPG